MKLQLFSERCSGSNFVESVLKTNIPSLIITREYGFKHWLTEKFLSEETFPDDFFFITIIRSPFDWLRSIYQKPWHCSPHLKKLSFSDFIRAEWYCVQDNPSISKDDPRWMSEMMFERNPLNSGKRFKNIIEARTVKYKLWGDRLGSHPKSIKLNYDTFNKSPDQFLYSLRDKFDITLREPLLIPKAYKGAKLSWKRKLALILSAGLIGSFRNKPKNPIALNDIDFIQNSLNLDQERSWGFDIESLAKLERDRIRNPVKQRNHLAEILRL